MSGPAEEGFVIDSLDRRAAIRRRKSLTWVILSRFARNRTALLGVAVILVFAVAAVFVPLLALSNPLYMDFNSSMQTPSMSHPKGTDSLSMDNLSRIIWGGRVSLQGGLLAMVIATSVGVSSGLAAGYYGRWIDTVIMRVVDAIPAFPALLLAILMLEVLGSSLRNTMLTIAVGLISSFAGSSAPIRCPSARRSTSRAREPSAPAPYGS